MQSFTYWNTTRIHFGKGQIARIAEEVPADARVLVTYGGGSVLKNGVMDQVRAALAGRTVIEFGGIEANPHFETLVKAAELARAEKVDFLLAVGGGSVADGTKFVAAAALFEGDPWDILVERGTNVRAALPVGCVITLPATGSEMNRNAVITRASTQDKLPMNSVHVMPRFSVLDPETTFSLPPRQTANGVVDSFMHVLEQYLTYPVGAKVQDRFAEGLLLTILEEGPKALGEPANYEVRANLMWAATLALNDLLSRGVPGDWATHRIGHELTGLYGLDHAATLAVVLPSLLKVKRAQKREKLLQYAERVFGITTGSEDERIDAAIERTRAFFEAMGVRTRLADYGLDAKVIPEVAEKLRQHWQVPLGEHRDVTPEVASEILGLAL
ncbi:alcohol dehydrogenase, NAD(P)-dependent [uncultured Pleomorphomonas sp.]|uniref:Alcohol dehydrogenase, NAD(P)-dependent n=1 Tax=uncultured Pleomorphomonas sp. TaxID=442121 RepID=A0A212L038_9HYPH|nr:iron-containing alcohol dehydrogenase [uncultured Pleomorphomonas sp.]SCM70749.1 alcohol dehydrogenase, NAD(P)-dependent [uncultured Pleomorphomonas sp.]